MKGKKRVMDYTKGKRCKDCLVVLSPENFPAYRSILLCNKHYSDYCAEQYERFGRAYHQSRKNDPERKHQMAKSQKKQKEMRPEKHKARRKLQYAIDSGKISPKPCMVCKEAKVHGHHYDYSKPLDVIWLCRKHHLDLHNGKL